MTALTERGVATRANLIAATQDVVREIWFAHATTRAITEVATLPKQAGEGTVVGNLTTALQRLATLRERIIPLEMAMRSDPELSERRRTMTPPIPPDAIAQYPGAEQNLGRIRHDVNCLDAALVLLATLFGIGLMPNDTADMTDRNNLLIRSAAELFLHGLQP